MSAYYNEIDSYAAQWLRNLVSAGLIAPGDVDERSIADVQPEDLAGYTQCHFFAGLGLWSDALRRADWPDDRPVWTGSCPCQPLSGAGQRKGHADERHLWPAFHRFIAECRPAAVFGEQVASKDGREWFAGVRADLEALGYACGAADLCAAGVGAPHIRQRLYWVAYADGGYTGAERLQRSGEHGQFAQDGRDFERLADTGHEQARRSTGAGEAQGGRPFGDAAGRSACAKGLADAMRTGRPERWTGTRERQASGIGGDGTQELGDASGAGLARRQSFGGDDEPQCEAAERASGAIVPQWNGPTTIIECRDGFRRIPAQPALFPLAHGNKRRMGRGRAYLEAIATFPRADQGNRPGRLRAYGNAICPPLAAEFIRAAEECRP